MLLSAAIFRKASVVGILRRKFLRVAAVTAALPVILSIAKAQNYPSRPVRFVSGFPAGGAVDVVARLIGQWLSDRLGQKFIMENRPGAAGNIAAEAVANAVPDGYTILLAGVNNAIGAALYDKLNFNFMRDIAPVAGIMRVPNIMEVSPSVPAHTVSEFIDFVRANPGKVSYASSGVGTSVHMSAELFKLLAQVDLVHVPYNRGLMNGGYADLMTGIVHVIFDNLPGSIALVRAGKLRPLAVTTATRSALLPEVPTVAELLPGYEASAWYGIGVPSGTPAEVIGTLNREVNAALADPTMKARLIDLGGLLLPGSPVSFGKLIAEETEKWAKVVKFSGARVDSSAK
jgi:tripartite-type tricarboxylate transporter receptor subunit TctC